MNYYCIYPSGREFGSQLSFQDHVARVAPYESHLEITYESPWEKLAIRLGREEAIKLATSILSSLNHPTREGMEIAWKPNRFMPKIDKRSWSTLVKASPFDPPWPYMLKDANSISINNGSSFMIVRMKVELTLELRSEDRKTTEYKIMQTLDHNCSARRETIIKVDKNLSENLPTHNTFRIREVKLVGLFGIHSDQIEL